MLEIDHFSYGWLTPSLAYLMSVIGSLLGLRCVVRARTGPGRAGWLWAAAIAMGGTGIWVMHFIAMLGFSIQGATIRYDVPVTLLSVAIAIVVVRIGLTVVNRSSWGQLALPVGGTITGLGVGAMHYFGMYAMNSDAAMDYDTPVVVLSVVIAVAAATAALWFTLHVRGLIATLSAALIMGVAISGMHYTGMYALSAQSAMHAHVPSGARAIQLLAPLITTVSMVTMLLLLHVGITDIDDSPDPVRTQRTANRYWPTRH